MKAKEYVQMYKESNYSEEKLGEIISLFIKETFEIIEKRNCQRDSACIAVFKELDDKWRSFATEVLLDIDGYKYALKKVAPEAYEYWMYDTRRR